MDLKCSNYTADFRSVDRLSLRICHFSHSGHPTGRGASTKIVGPRTCSVMLRTNAFRALLQLTAVWPFQLSRLLRMNLRYYQLNNRLLACCLLIEGSSSFGAVAKDDRWCHSLSELIVCKLSTSCRQIFWWGSEETRLRKINIKRETTKFRLVQTLSKSNSPTSSIVTLCCEKLVAPDELRAATYIVKRTAL
jgi:hypothetical protein